MLSGTVLYFSANFHLLTPEFIGVIDSPKPCF
jgi:hypothetical protein